VLARYQARAIFFDFPRPAYAPQTSPAPTTHCTNVGPCRYDGKTLSWMYDERLTLEGGHRLVKYNKREGLPDSQSDTDKNFTYYPSMTEDKAGVLWMACGNDGVLKYDGEDVTHYATVDGAYALSIICDREGKLWVGTVEHGIHVFEGAGFEPFMPSAASK